VKLLRILVLGHIFAFCTAQIIAFVLFVNEPYILNLWCQILLAITFFVFTWFFNYEHKFAFVYSNIRGFDDEHSQSEIMRSKKVKKTPNINIVDFYKISGNFVIVENASNSEIRLASYMAAPNKANEIQSEEKSPKKSPKKKEFKKRAAKYLVAESASSSNVLQFPEIQELEDVIKLEQIDKSPAKDDKWLDLGNISLHFNDENEEEIEVKEIELAKKKPENQESQANMAIQLYPKPRMAKTVDFRKEIYNGSFYH